MISALQQGILVILMQHIPRNNAENKYLNSVAVHFQTEVMHFSRELRLPFSMLLY